MPVTRFEVRQRRPLASGVAFGEIGPYEELKGRLYFSIDPLHSANRRITDVELAPRGPNGRVEWSSDVSLLLPVDRAQCCGRALLDVVNRGNTVAVPNFNRATRPVFTPGDGFVSCNFNNFHLGLTICYDLRFPEVCRALTLEHGANVLINSSAWPFPRLEHLRILALTRAIENQSYLIVANRVGSDDGVTFCGTSVIIDPYGVIVAAASADREELIQAEISQDVIDAVRQRMAVFEHRRTDLY